jgi:chromosome segregation ATPase
VQKDLDAVAAALRAEHGHLAAELREAHERREQEKARHAEAVRALEQKQGEALANLKSSLDEETLGKIQDLAAAHAKELAGRDRVFEQANEAHTRALRDARRAADEALVASQEELSNERARALEELAAAHASQLAEARRATERAEQGAEKKVASAQRANMEAIERALAGARDEMVAAVSERDSRMEDVLGKHQSERRDLEKQRDEARGETTRLSEQLAAASAKTERHAEELARALASLRSANDELAAERRARSEEGRQLARRGDELRALRAELEQVRAATDARRAELDAELVESRGRERAAAASAARLDGDRRATEDNLRRELSEAKAAAERGAAQLVASQAALAKTKREGAQAMSAVEGEVARLRGAVERHQMDLTAARTAAYQLEQALAAQTGEAARGEAIATELHHRIAHLEAVLARAGALAPIEHEEVTTNPAGTYRTSGDGDQSRRIALLERQLEQARVEAHSRNDALARQATEHAEQIEEWQKAYDDVITRHAAEINDLRATMKQELELVRLQAEEERTDAGTGSRAIADADREEISKRWKAAERQHEATHIALEAEVQSLRAQLERDHALLKRARALLGKQLEDGVEGDD